MLVNMAINHTVIVEEEKRGSLLSNNEQQYNSETYNASSPDELALVNAAKYFGVVFCQRESGRQNTIRIDYRGTELTYELLNIIEFSSNRKRMSSIVRDPDGRIFVFCKGADQVILPLLKKKCNAYIKRKTQQDLEAYAKEGLRTLVFCEKEITEEQY